MTGCSGICDGCSRAVTCPILPDKLTWEGTAFLHALREFGDVWKQGINTYVDSAGRLHEAIISRRIPISADIIRVGGRA